jgi:DedD protein
MAKQMNADEESVLKRQSRRRLIGAIALTTAVVVILPIVFDGEPPANRVSDIELRIPDKDKTDDLKSGVALSAVSGVSSAVVSASAPASTMAPVVLPAVTAAAIIAAPVADAAVSQHLQEGMAEQAKPEVVKPTQPEHKIEAKPKVEVQPKAEAKSAAPHHPVPHSGFAVQVGAFSNAEAAKKLQDKLVAQGLHAYTEKVGGKVRVRVGGFSTHEAADKVRHKLESQGLHPNVVSLGS